MIIIRPYNGKKKWWKLDKRDADNKYLVFWAMATVLLTLGVVVVEGLVEVGIFPVPITGWHRLAAIIIVAICGVKAVRHAN